MNDYGFWSPKTRRQANHVSRQSSPISHKSLAYSTGPLTGNPHAGILVPRFCKEWVQDRNESWSRIEWFRFGDLFFFFFLFLLHLHSTPSTDSTSGACAHKGAFHCNPFRTIPWYYNTRGSKHRVGKELVLELNLATAVSSFLTSFNSCLFFLQKIGHLATTMKKSLGRTKKRPKKNPGPCPLFGSRGACRYFFSGGHTREHAGSRINIDIIAVSFSIVDACDRWQEEKKKRKHWMNSAIQLGRELGGYAWVFPSWPFGYQTKSKQTEKCVHNDSRTSYTTTHAQRFRLVVSASTEKLQLARRKWDKLNLKGYCAPCLLLEQGQRKNDMGAIRRFTM